ncbi:MAG: TetR/AcrR family transcriptional regulator [Chitinophagales bacterium]|nr:TetR/AcrR family transcriptional regulator [Chitinophagales bacterium]
MLVKERRRKEKEELRQQILDVAKDIAANDGWQNVTIRKICEQIHYTAPVVYQYFASKEMILQSLRKDGFVQVFNLFEEVDKKYKLPEKRLFEYALTWWNFAIQHPEIYQVMFNLQGAVCLQNESSVKINNNVMDYYHPAFKLLNKKAKRSEEYNLELTDNLIAIIHGFISMNMANKIKSGNEKALVVFKNSLQRFIQSINDINS